MVSPHVEPVSFRRTADGAIIAEVRQSVRDLEGKPHQGQTHGLKDKAVGHVFRLREGKGCALAAGGQMARTRWKARLGGSLCETGRCQSPKVSLACLRKCQSRFGALMPSTSAETTQPCCSSICNMPGRYSAASLVACCNS